MCLIKENVKHWESESKSMNFGCYFNKEGRERKVGSVSYPEHPQPWQIHAQWKQMARRRAADCFENIYWKERNQDKSEIQSSGKKKWK